jgi:hypothetical protein
MANQALILSRPIRATVIVFAVLAFLIGTCAPFVDGVDAVVVFCIGLPYCVLVSLFAVGFALGSGGAFARWWLLSGIVPLVCVVAFCMWLKSGSNASLDLLPAFAATILTTIGAWLFAGVILACCGWVRFGQRLRSPNTV